jgi:SNF2 family DNA or RNA helicase
MDYQDQVPRDIIQRSEKFFSGIELVRAKQLNEDQKINVSFSKARSNDGFIISGLVQDAAQESARCTLKADGEISSSCTCSNWTKESHCRHVISLFLKYYLINYFKEKYENMNDGEKPQIMPHGLGVHAKSYGTVITSPRLLEGAAYNSTYASLQYVLTTNKIYNFPIAEKFKGKIKINLIQANTLEQYKELNFNEDVCTCLFEHITGDDYNSKISIFEYLYLFNWKTGEAYHLTDQIRDFIKKIKISNFLIPINDFLILIKELVDQDMAEIYFNNEKITFEDALETQTVVEIQGSNRKNYLDISVKTLKDNLILSPPKIFKLMTFEHGHLEGFKTKNEASEFVAHLSESLNEKDGFYKRYSHGARSKDELLIWSENVIKNENTFFYEIKSNQLFKYNNKSFTKLLNGMVQSFTPSFVRYSGFDLENKEVFFQIPKRVVLDGVAEFFDHANGDDITVYYNSKKIKTWSSNIKFERNESSLDWFDLTLQIDAKDMDLIKNADISEKYFVGDEGLVLLTPEQKDLLKFMQKYTRYEKISTDDSTDGPDERTHFGLSLKRARIFELFELRKLGIHGALTQEEITLCEDLQNLKEVPEFPVPENFIDIARPYQVTGYNWMRFLHKNGFGACLADDMGLGKTIQTIMFLESIIDSVEKVLIICPVSIILNWQKEIEKFANFNVGVYYGENREFLEDKKVYLTSYGIMKKEAYGEFEQNRFDVVIFDEVQHLKNIKSLGANAARKLNAKFRICLTGTPVENDISEFYNIMDLAVPGVWGELGFIKTSSSRKNRLLAKKTVKPFILRRRKSEVLKELPDKVEQCVYLNFSDEEKINYSAKLLSIKEKLKSDSVKRKYGEILKGLLELRQHCLWQKDIGVSTKVNFLMENLEQIVEEGHKVLVFSQFTTYLDKIQNEITKKNWPTCRIDGSMTMKNRHKQVEEFQEGKTQIFLISLKAGGVGLNLTAANYIFLMDPWWNPAVENQAIDRAHRIGQENKVTVYRPIMKDSVEEKVLILQDSKRALFKELLDEDSDYFSGKLNMTDFEMLLT